MTTASLLPTEIIQSILSFTNPDTFCSARLACSTWLHAASTAFMIRKALDQAPFTLPPIHSMTEEDWNLLFSHVAHLNLLGMRDHTAKTITRRTFPTECSPSTTFKLSNDGRKLVILKGSRVNVYDLRDDDNGGAFQLSFSRSLYPLWTTVFWTLAEGGAGFFAISEQYAKYRLAISSTGDVVAIGLGRSIQIYDLNDAETLVKPVQHILGVTHSSFSSSPPPPDYVETDGFIRSMEFAEDDTLLRVVLERESNPYRPTRVRYMGDPMEARRWNGSKLDYWKANLHRIYIDSTALAASFQQNDNKVAFRELRLLPTTFNRKHLTDNNNDKSTEAGRFFAASLQTPEIRGYCVGFVPDSDQRQVGILRLFPSQATTATTASTTTNTSKLHAQTITSKDAEAITENLQSARARWNSVNLPPTTAEHPHLAVSDDSKLLVVFEPGAGHLYPFASGGALYVYCLECGGPAYSRDCCGWGKLGGAYGQVWDVFQPWSFLLDIVDCDVEGLRCEFDSGVGGYTITALSARQLLRWHMK